MKTPIRGSGLSSLKLCSNGEIRVLDVSIISRLRFLIEILVYHLHGSVLFFRGLCKRNVQYKWYPNRHISTSVGHFRVIVKRNGVVCSLWYWHDTVHDLCILHCVACAMGVFVFSNFWWWCGCRLGVGFCLLTSYVCAMSAVSVCFLLWCVVCPSCFLLCRAYGFSQVCVLHG